MVLQRNQSFLNYDFHRFLGHITRRPWSLLTEEDRRSFRRRCFLHYCQQECVYFCQQKMLSSHTYHHRLQQCLAHSDVQGLNDFWNRKTMYTMTILNNWNHTVEVLIEHQSSPSRYHHSETARDRPMLHQLHY
uniref:Uncharacterized protein n=1 Tax=Anopheles dirus TaxID=7168 RepID=A0A182NXB9_9DIPT